MKEKFGPRQGTESSRGFLICTGVQRMEHQEGAREAAGDKVAVISLPKLATVMVGIQGPLDKVI